MPDKVPLPVVSLILLASMALLVRVGMAVHACGVSRSKNAASAIIRSVVEMAAAMLAFWVCGGAIMMGTGNAGFGFNVHLLFLTRGTENFVDMALFYDLVLVLIATGPVSAALGERARLLPVVVIAVLLGGFIVPLCGYWSWIEGGLLNRIGFIDSAGAGTLHITGGLAAGIGAIFVGARQGKYNNDGSSNLIPGHSVALGTTGMLFIAAGWVPYVVGASLLHNAIATRVALNVMLAAAAAIVISYGMSRSRYGKSDVMLTLSGLLGGLVSITAGAGFFNPVAAVAVGALGGWLVMWATVFVDMNLKIDDPSGTMVAHLFGGVWGILAVAIFSPQESFAMRARLVGVQAAGAILMIVLTGIIIGAAMAVLKSMNALRASAADEYDGLDLAEHDLNAYPDFQQTMIKSYHLREA